ncbi:hypothetical protein [Pontibacter lucknowensis]|uniref:Tetratricopeptide repeat-containing protein n=1 Tax=Pontibacter lucknowensis TaxID=1077936 RepID=A0A1N6X4R3_9BACT|nr:hypothetical protein [Pontibacter lucknowensis]SIQ97315.1 hypothetical protein SAMN05421545_1925 [Pontibacter lucknowensis]
MNKSAFLKLIKQVSDISDQQQSELEQVAATFPYCQTAHLLLAKSAYDKGSMLSTQRLRRASAYATDRQLLKRIIYTSPVLELAYAEETALEAEAEIIISDTVTHQENDTAVAVAEEAVTEDAETSEAIPEPEASTPEETLKEVYAPAPVEESLYLESEPETESPDAEIDSELALLFTFNSISSSSTDLLSQREEESLEAGEQETEHAHLTEAAEVLHELEETQQTDLVASDAEDQHVEIEVETEEEAIPVPQAEAYQADSFNTDTSEAENTESDSDIFAEEADEPALASAEDAEINYSFDEIDRLYAEDALGYWMGSSRMGEVLQLKDDYTRSRPQSFHPELILEYSKTHELEKAIQPTAHVLSKQLDIIDQFLKLNPKLKTMANLKLKPEPQEDLSLKSSKIKKGMASESLANIFIQQGKPKKAVKIYEQLILKYPEKKSYFAEQIEKLQNIT